MTIKDLNMIMYFVSMFLFCGIMIFSKAENKVDWAILWLVFAVLVKVDMK